MVRMYRPAPIIRPKQKEEKPPAYQITPTPSPSIPPGGLAERKPTKEELDFIKQIEADLPFGKKAVITQITETPEGKQVEYVIYEGKYRRPRPIWGGWFPEGIPKGMEVRKVTETPEGYELEYVPIGTPTKEPEPFTLEWLLLSMEKMGYVIESFDPWKAGMGFAETVTGKKYTVEERKQLEQIGGYFSGEYLQKKYGVRVGYKALEEFKYVGLSFTPFAPSPLNPEEYWKAIQEHPGYLIGDVTQFYLLMEAIWGAGKWVKGKIRPKMTKYDLWAKYQRSQLGETPNFLSSEGWEKFYVQTQQRTPIGAFERPYEPAWRVYQGYPQTPMEVTLGKVIPDSAGAGFYRELIEVPEPALTKFVTRHIHKPFIPEFVFQPSKSYLKEFLAVSFGATQILKTGKKTISVPKPKTITIPKIKDTQISRIFQTPAKTSKVAPFEVPVTKIKQTQKALQKTIQNYNKKIQTTTTTFKIPKFPFEAKPKRKERGLFGEWFKREHKIKTPEQMMKTYLGTPKGRGRKKRNLTF